MWNIELNPAVPPQVKEEKKLVGGKEDWYKKANDYWNVIYIKMSNNRM